MKTVFITGANSDIGIELCRKYLSEGFYVIAHYHSNRPEFEVLLRSSDKIEFYQCDFSQVGQLEKDIEKDGDFFSRADVFVHLAAQIKPIAYKETMRQDILNAMNCNVIPSILLSQIMVPQMMERGFGRLVLGSSIGVKFGGNSSNYCYSFSKHALEFLPSEINLWAKKNVLSNVMRIGVTETRAHKQTPEKNLLERKDMVPLGRMATCQEIAQSLYWLGSEENTYISGQVIACSGGE